MDEQASEQAPVSRNPVVKTTWPKTIGIVTLLFGVLGGLKGAGSILSSFFSEMLAKASNLPPEFYDKWRPFMLGSGAGEICLGIFLFLGGFMLLYRKRFAVVILVLWALMKMLFGVVGTFFNYLMQKEQLPLMLEQQRKAMQKAGGAGGGAGTEQVAEMVTSMTQVISTVMLFAGLIWVMVLPLFILIWFIRPKIRRELATWGRES